MQHRQMAERAARGASEKEGVVLHSVGSVGVWGGRRGQQVHHVVLLAGEEEGGGGQVRPGTELEG